MLLTEYLVIVSVVWCREEYRKLRMWYLSQWIEQEILRMSDGSLVGTFGNQRKIVDFKRLLLPRGKLLVKNLKEY